MTIPRNRKATSDSASNAEIVGWVQAFLTDKPLSSSKKVLEWQEWSIRRLSEGWDVEDVKQRIRDSWAAWVLGGNVDTDTMPMELQKALAEVYQMANEGSTPRHCAVVYRSLSNQYPDRPWLLNAARDWEAMGDVWREGA